MTAARVLVGFTLRAIERWAIIDTFRAFKTIRATAEALGISERKIHYRLKEYREIEVRAKPSHPSARCALCGAAAGKPCRTPSNATTKPHKIRVRRAAALGRAR